MLSCLNYMKHNITYIFRYFILLVIFFICVSINLGNLQANDEYPIANTIDITRVLSSIHISSKEIDDLMSLKWEKISKGMLLSFNEIIMTDDQSEVDIKVSKELYIGDLDDSALHKMDGNYVYFKIYHRSIFIFKYLPHIYTSDNIQGIVDDIKGTPIISKEHNKVSVIITKPQWKNIIMRVDHPISITTPAQK